MIAFEAENQHCPSALAIDFAAKPWLSAPS